ncbi:MAG: hypothetical protein HY291_06975 [Planctomycetes bacterium]|nr:hypothetical protein [Planctomycetota bacterium]
MDMALIEFVAKQLPAVNEAEFSSEKPSIALDILDADKGEIEVVLGEAKLRHTLRPINELYATKPEPRFVDAGSNVYLPMVMAIEQTILTYYDSNPGLTDGTVQMALDRLAIDPGAHPILDELCQSIQMRIRISLSLDEFTKREVVAVLRKISKSVQRHSKLSGHRGYLEFIVKFNAGNFNQIEPWE